MFLWVCLWVIPQLLPQALVYDKGNHAVTLVVSICCSCFVLKAQTANWSLLCLVALLPLKCSCTSADCISFHFQEQMMPFLICLVCTKGWTSPAGVCTLLCSDPSEGVQAHGKGGEHSWIHILQDESCTIRVESLWKQQSPGEWCKQMQSALCLSVCLSSTAPGGTTGAELRDWALLRSCDKEETLVLEAVSYPQAGFRLLQCLERGNVWCCVLGGLCKTLWDQLGPAVVFCSDSHCKKWMFRNRMGVMLLQGWATAWPLGSVFLQVLADALWV